MKENNPGLDLNTRLFAAVQKETEALALVKDLILRGADIDVKDNDKGASTLLHKACSERNAGMVQLLLDHGADVNAVSAYGETAVHIAAAHGFADILELLINNGGSINAKTNAGWTPLHEACWQGRVAAARVLFERGADPNARDNNGATPLDKALSKDAYPFRREEIVDLFREYAPDLVMERFCTGGPGR